MQGNRLRLFWPEVFLKVSPLVRMIIAAAFALGLVGIVPASAKIMTAEQAKRFELKPEIFICPLTGKRFEQIVTHPHYPIESFPDGSHLGDEWIDMQIPECPDDRLLILPDYAASDQSSGKLAYHAYSANELAQLPGLIATAEWRELMGQTRHLRAYWLASQIRRPAKERYQLLLHAPWGAESDNQRRTALDALVSDLPEVVAEFEDPPEDRIFALYYVVDALRQLGRFEEALALADTLDAQPVDAEPGEDPDWEHARSGFSEQQRRAIALEDSDRFAIETLDDRMAGRLCAVDEFQGMRGPNAGRSCKAREDRLAQQQEEFDAVYALLDDREALAKNCEIIPLGSRGSTLAEACRMAKHEADWAEGERLAKDEPSHVAAICERVPDHKRDTVQTSACGWYEGFKAAAIKDLLLADEAAYGALCDTSTMLGYGTLSQGCTGASRIRNDRQARALWLDKEALRATCRNIKSLENEFDGRHIACMSLEDGTEDPYWLDGEGETGADTDEPLYDAALPFAQAEIAARRRASD